MRHPRLLRLDALARSLADDPDVVAVLGLGSAGVEHARFDDHSDIDFFVIVDDPQAVSRHLSDSGWLAAMGTVVYSFANDRNGRKALFDDGLFVEYAIFTPTSLRAVPMAGVRVIWQRAGGEIGDLTAGVTTDTALDTVEFHLNEALTNLFVGLHRELRGERLTAFRFIQVFAVDRVLALVRLSADAPDRSRDPFDATRRVESAYPDVAAVVGSMLPGYEQNARAAAAVLDWLTGRFETDDSITVPIRALVVQAASQHDRDVPGTGMTS